MTFEAARQHSGGDAASGGFSTFLLTLLLSLFTAFLFQPFGNGHHQLLMPGRLRRQRADQRPRMFRGSRLQHIAQQRIHLRFCQIALRHQRNQRHLQLGQIAMADMLLQQLQHGHPPMTGDLIIWHYGEVHQRKIIAIERLRQRRIGE